MPCPLILLLLLLESWEKLQNPFYFLKPEPKYILWLHHHTIDKMALTRERVAGLLPSQVRAD